jgi:hypothetical protein
VPRHVVRCLGRRDDRLLAMGGVIGFGLGTFFTIPQWGPMWRGETHEAKLESPPSWWPYSHALWQVGFSPYRGDIA